MLLWLLLATILVATVLAVVLDRPIPTPIPRHLVRLGRDLSSNGLGMTVYRIGLVAVVVASGVLTLLVNPSGVIAFFAAGLFLWVFMDDLQQTLLDIWNGNFWRIDP